VIPKDNPTVPNAETTSKSICIKENRSLNRITRNTTRITEMNAMVAKANDFLIASRETRRPKRLTSCRPFRVDHRVLVMIAKVVVLIPPPVPPGLAPMNIRKMTTITLMRVMFSRGIVLNPAVRGVTDWKRQISPLAGQARSRRVAGFRNSRRKSARNPPTISPAVVKRTIRECVETRVRCRM